MEIAELIRVLPRATSVCENFPNIGGTASDDEGVPEIFEALSGEFNDRSSDERHACCTPRVYRYR